MRISCCTFGFQLKPSDAAKGQSFSHLVTDWEWLYARDIRGQSLGNDSQLILDLKIQQIWLIAIIAILTCGGHLELD